MSITESQVKTMTKALQEFGYPSVDSTLVRTEAEKILAGEKPNNIIGMFVQGWLREAGLIS